MITYNRAIKIVIAILFIALFYHLLIIAQVVPYQYAWGGKLKNIQEMLVFEIISIFLNSLFLIVVLVKGKYLNILFLEKWQKPVLWIMVIVFSVNTIGNLFAEKNLEMVVGGMLTFSLALLCFRIVVQKSPV
jgi:hypothetical protein